MNDQIPCDGEKLAEFAKKLSLIAKEEDPCVSDLWKCLKQPQPVISQHLAILKEAEIVIAEVHKTKRVYSIADPFIRELIDRILLEEDIPAIVRS